jgi:glycosyltransferase involved in cell wall biosynthesis
MRVLIVMTAREIGGAELYVERLTRALSSQCHFTVLLPTHPRVEALARRLTTHAQVIRLAIEDQRRLLTAVRAVRALARQADVVHLNSNHPGSRLGILFGFALARAGAPLVCVEHRVTRLDDIIIPNPLRPFLPHLFRWSRQGAVRVVTVSKQNAELLTSYYGLRTDRIAIIHNATDLPQFDESQVAQARAALRAELGLPENAIVILTLARLAPNKGHRYLVEAIPEILRMHPNAYFVFAGEHVKAEPVIEQINALGLGPHVHLLGFRSDTQHLLAASDFFVLPSLAEGFSLALVEALAFGLPTVATDVGGASEVIQPGQGGLLVPPANSAALAAALNHLLSLDKAEIQRQRSAARLAAQPFSTQAMAEKTLRVYLEAVHHRTHLRNGVSAKS